MVTLTRKLAYYYHPLKVTFGYMLFSLHITYCMKEVHVYQRITIAICFKRT